MSRPPPTAGFRPGGSQFSLRGMFLLITAASVILAILSLVIKTPLHWVGALVVPVICAILIAAVEIGRVLFPPQPRFPPYLPPLPKNPLQTAYFADGDYPFAAEPDGGEENRQQPEIHGKGDGS